MYEALGIITFWIGVIGFFDLVVPKEPRNRISEFIFGFHDITARTFESAVTDGVLSFFLRDGRWRIWRVFLFSYALTTAFTISLFVYLQMAVEGADAWSAILGLATAYLDNFFEPTPTNIPSGILICVLFVFCFPMDFFSLWVSKRLFWQKRRTMFGYLGMILLDVFLSLAPFFGLAAMNIWDRMPEEMTFFTGIFALIIAGISFQWPTTIFLSLLQIITLVVGATLRFLLMATRLNSYTAMYTTLHEAPFSFLGLIVGLCVLLWSIIL